MSIAVAYGIKVQFLVVGQRRFTMIQVKCSRCKHKWEYNGIKEKLVDKYPQYVSCPKCRTSVKLKKELKGDIKK